MNHVFVLSINLFTHCNAVPNDGVFFELDRYVNFDKKKTRTKKLITVFWIFVEFLKWQNNSWNFKNFDQFMYINSCHAISWKKIRHKNHVISKLVVHYSPLYFNHQFSMYFFYVFLQITQSRVKSPINFTNGLLDVGRRIPAKTRGQ